MLAIIGINLTACGNSRQSITADPKNIDRQTYSNVQVGYSFSVPNGFGHETDDDEGMYFGYGENSKFGQISVQSYDHLQSAQCTETLLGASRVSVTGTMNTKSMWGKVDFFEIQGSDYLPENAPKCRPMSGKNGVGYAFCSEHEGQTVLICIGQKRDNPQLAKEIFESFRWTK